MKLRGITSCLALFSLLIISCEPMPNSSNNVTPIIDIPTANDELLNKGNLAIADSIFTPGYGGG